MEFAAKNGKNAAFRPPKEKDLSAGCLLRAPPRGESFFISINPYTRRGDVRELISTHLNSTYLDLTRLILACLGLSGLSWLPFPTQLGPPNRSKIASKIDFKSEQAKNAKMLKKP